MAGFSLDAIDPKLTTIKKGLTPFIKLSVSGKIKVIDVDTDFFTENYPISAAIEACYPSNRNLENAKWQKNLPNSILSPRNHHIFTINFKQIFTYIHINI